MCDYRTTPLPSAVTSNGISIEVLCCVFVALSAREFRIVSLDHWYLVVLDCVSKAGH
jgi:hypothetical protein